MVREPKVPVMQGARSTNLPTKYSFHVRLCTLTDTEQTDRCKQGYNNTKQKTQSPGRLKSLSGGCPEPGEHRI